MAKLKTPIHQSKHQSAALIIALLIVTVASAMVLGIGKRIVASTFTSNRFADAVIAEQAAWAGVEDGLMRLKESTTWTRYFPQWPADMDSEDPGYEGIMDKVMRRNITDDEISGLTTQAANVNSIYTGTQYPGLRNIEPIVTACRIADDLLRSGFSPPKYYNTDRCNIANWGNDDTYYDVRTSGADDDGRDMVGGLELHSVNLIYPATVKNKFGYYKVSSNEGLIVRRFFDMTKYTGNTYTGNDDHQRIVFYYEKDPSLVIPAGGNITINFFAKYKWQDNCTHDPSTGTCNPPGNSNNDNLECKSPITAGGVTRTKMGDKDNFYGTINNQITSSSPNTGYFLVYLPSSCVGNPFSDGSVEYFGAKFYFPVGATGNIYFGLRHSSFPPTWYAFDNSYIGTGITNIISTGIFGDARKTIAIKAYKAIYEDIGDTDGDGKYLQCQGGANNGSGNLSLCRIIIYRDNKY